MDTKDNYRIYDGTGGGATEDIHAVDLDDAIEQGREWIENGDWNDSGSDAQITTEDYRLSLAIAQHYRP